MDIPLENLDLDVESGIARITIESTSHHNSLNAELAEEFLAIVTALSENDTIKCIVLTGSNGVFCAGADLTMFEGEPSDAVLFRRTATTFHDCLIQLLEAEVPVVAGVNGPAVGAGFSLAISADIVVVNDAATFEFGYTNVGLPGDGGITYYLPRLVGLRRAKEIALLGKPIQPAEAVEIGLATEAVSPQQFESRLDEVVDQIASGPTRAFGIVKKLLTRSFDRGIAEQLAAETDCIARAAHTRDYARGLAAFEEDAQPEFQGK